MTLDPPLSQGLIAIAVMAGHLVTLDSNHHLEALSIAESEGHPRAGPVRLRFPAHPQAVMGVSTLQQTSSAGAIFFTWSADGRVLFWNLQADQVDEMEVELEQLPTGEENLFNELKVVRASPEGDFFVSGDKYGVLRFVDPDCSEVQV